MSAIRTLLIDDEPLALRGLAIRLADFADIEIIGTSSNGRDAVRQIRELSPDLIFLDIQMPGFDGFSVLRVLVGEAELPLVIFCTAFDQYALDAFEAHAVDYLLKPVEDTRLREAIQRARDHHAQRTAIEQNARLIDFIDHLEPGARDKLSAVLEDTAASHRSNSSKQKVYAPHLHIRDRGHIAIIPVRDIDYIDAAGDYMCIHEGDKTHILRETMKNMEKRLDPKSFQRIHRSTIVNLERVKTVRPHANGECFLTLENGAELKVSRSHKDVVARFW